MEYAPMQVDIIINLPVMQFNSLYTYSVPTPLESTIQPGIRVLVELGKKQVEGIIASVADIPGEPEIKPIVCVLDEEPVLSLKQIELARWISDSYLCPLPMAINLMTVPLKKKLKKCVKAAITPEEYHDLSSDSRSSSDLILLKYLWQEGEISFDRAQTVAGPDIISNLYQKHMIMINAYYGPARPVQSGVFYALNPGLEFEVIYESLSKRAPQQTKALSILHEQGPIECSQFRKMVSSSSIAALLKKEYIIKQQSSTVVVSRPFQLNKEQKKVLVTIKQRINCGQYTELLLYGITGSGKTEIYIEAAQTVINSGKTVMILVPEIALTRHLVDVFSERFARIAVLHSGISKSQRAEQWRRIRKGEIDLVLGTRSAVFAPLDNIGLIVIDEEQENTYKQEETPRYHAREVAAFRARQDNAVLLMGSATPSLETFHRAITGEIELLTLMERAGNAALPEISVADRKENYKQGQSVLTELLLDKIENNLLRHEQTILFINRRGHTPVTTCMNCGKTLLCPHCSVALNFHYDINSHVCHYCNFTTSLLNQCPYCGSRHLYRTGTGTQKVEEIIRNHFPHARVKRLDMDSSRKKGYQEEILRLMQDKKIDILIGTQMVAKGLDFPAVSLVGVVDADSSLNLPDFRSAERCFQLIVQAAGRAGRGDIAGEVVIQTYNPHSNIIQMAARQDYMAFYKSEIMVRETLHYPPFTNLLRIVVVAEEEQEASADSQEITEYIRDITDASEEYLEILGPAPCPLAKIRNRYRYQIIVKCDSLLLITSIAKYIIYNDTKFSSRVEVEVNPLTTI
jgi:primosomal protein N' (replication factor Y)